MTSQANNFIKICRGGNPITIKGMLLRQKSSIVEELKDHFGTSNIDKLAVKLSIGR